MLVEDYMSSDSGKICATWFLGIKPSRDGNSKEAIADWQTTITEILDIYNHSPFGKWSGGSLIGLVDILVKLTGMNTDHCTKEKKDVNEIEELKKWAVNQHLREEAMLEKSMQEFYELQMAAQKNMIQAAGGLLSLEFGRRCRVWSRARRWLQLVGCAALLLDASNFGGPDGVGESGIEPRRSLRKTRAS